MHRIINTTFRVSRSEFVEPENDARVPSLPIRSRNPKMIVAYEALVR